MAMLIDGKAEAARLRERLAAEVLTLRAGGHPVPGLAVVIVGDHPASRTYVRTKTRVAAEVGIDAREIALPERTTTADLLAVVGRLNADAAVHGILVQLPLPPGVATEAILAAIDPAKDVDGFHPLNAGRLVQAADRADLLVPCTPLGVLHLLGTVHGATGLAGAHAVVVGRSNIVGKPVAALLLAADCTVTVAHSKSRDLPDLCRAADVLVAAVGRPELVRGSWIKPGATVIDVGINRVEGPGGARLVGDVAFAEAMAVAGAVTPVPGGVGPMTVACLMRNTLIAYRLQVGGA